MNTPCPLRLEPYAFHYSLQFLTTFNCAGPPCLTDALEPCSTRSPRPPSRTPALARRALKNDYDPSSPVSVAHRLTGMGYHCLPIIAGTKACTLEQWQRLKIPLDKVPDYWPPAADNGIGVLLGYEVAPGVYTAAIDIDVDDELLISRVRSAFDTEPPAKFGSKGMTFFCRTAAPIRKRLMKRVDPITKAGKNVIEVLAAGQQTVIPPSIHNNGNAYEWRGMSLCDVAPSSLPPLTNAVITEIEQAVKANAEKTSPLFGLNDMVSNSGKGGGTVHNSVLAAVAAMVALQWDDEQIWSRVLRATDVAVRRSGSKEYDWPSFEQSVRKMAQDARLKGFDKVDKKDKLAMMGAMWLLNDWRGKDRVLLRNGQLNVYKDGYYKALTPSDIRHVVATEWESPSPVDHKDFEAIMRTALDKAPRWPDVTPVRRVCLANGTFDMDSQQFGPWSPDDYLISQLPFNYDENATCPVYEEFLDTTFFVAAHPGDREIAISTYEEFLAHTLFECLRYQKFLVIKGQPGSGKSTLLHIARMLHSPKAVSSVNVEQLGTDRGRASMIGKLLNIVSEVKAMSEAADDFLKSVASGDSVEVRYLYQENERLILPTRILIACNFMFRIRDTSGAVERRMLILSCDNVVSKEKKDEVLGDKLEREMPGIFNRIARAWPRLRDRRGFLTPASHDEELKAFSEENNNVMLWLKDRTHQGALMDNAQYAIPSNGLYTENPILYLDYAQWAKDMGFKTLSSVSWGMRLKGMGFETEVKWLGGRAIRMRAIGLINGGKY